MNQYIKQNESRFYDELFSLLRIPSVSSEPEHAEDMTRCAFRLTELLMEAGADSANVYPTEGHPVVFAQKIIDPSRPTVLVYGHYDVQPVDPIGEWKSDPFEPEIRDGAIYARGANDDKGQIFMHLKAFEYLVKTGQLNHNVKFIFEGEEEISSPSLPAWVRDNKEMLSCDVILVSDTTMISAKVPSINCGMRGLAYMEIVVKGPSTDLHSGHYGGAVANPANVLCDIISQLIDKDGRVTIKGFYDDVVELSAEEREMLSRAPFDEEEFAHEIGVRGVRGEKGYTSQERRSIRPCLDVNGIVGGFTAEGSKTIIPKEARAKVSMRLVPNQRCGKIAELFRKHIKAIAPSDVTVEVYENHGCDGFLIPVSSPAYKAASRAMGEVYGIEPVPARGGGSIGILAEMQQVLGADPLLMGFGLERDFIHSPNESYLLSQLFKGMESIALFYE
ncbi:MAG: dipeptidase, partial [Bacteroidales bacterium]|nr:dipeptidase [Bacteroidales bacterium]